MLKKVLIANRGEIACRIIRTAKRMGIATVAVYSDADAKALHVIQADESVHIGASPAPESYLRIDKIIAAAKATGADAIHPGYGFLSENPDLPDACKAAGVIFIGPSAAAMRSLGGKAAAKDLAIKAGVPVVPGYQGKAQDLKTLATEAKKIGYPVMIKAVAGGGGRGMRLVERESDLSAMLDSAKREAASAFGNDHVLLEKVVVKPRHIEVQVFGDSHGHVVHLFERDCSLQRRNQKVIEEAPAPGMSPALREKMCAAAVKLAKSVGYEGAGTVEFLVEGGALSTEAPWYFIEMNTRLQVEHPVTEEITGLDLVEWQFRVAAGKPLPLSQDKITMSGHAIEVRLCAEDPANGFMPSVGRITILDPHRLKPDTRFETGVRAGDSVSPFYDSMIAKVIEHGVDRRSALRQLIRELNTFPVAGLRTNVGFLVNLLAHPDVVGATMETGLIGRDLAALTDQRLSRGLVEATCQQFIQARAWACRGSSDDGYALDDDAWTRPDGFQLGDQSGAALDRLTTLLINGQEQEVRVRWTAAFGEQQRDWPKVTLPTSCDVLDRELPEQHAVHTDSEGVVYGFEHGRQVVIAQPTYDASAIDDGAGSGAVRAPINGRVAKLAVKVGDTVAKGDMIAVVEAMKMEHILTAAVAGTIEKLGTSEGTQVNQGALIATIVEG
jgi:3-methylcrotonyl-CoA carboxylase alpha subunit